MEDLDFHTAGEWQPIDQMPDGCNDVEVKNQDGTIFKMCSCDYWWAENKSRYVEFRYI